MEKLRLKNGRGAKALYGTSGGIINEIISLICGLILPRLILSAFGSKYNGLTSSIAEFISIISLMQIGIGSVSRAAFYKPLAEKDYKHLSACVNQTQRFLRRVAIIFLIFVTIFALVYAIFFNTKFDFWFTFTLVIIISSTTFAQYYFGLARRLIIEADQKLYITSAVNCVFTILNTLSAVVLIVVLKTDSIHIVKLVSALVYLIQPIFYYLYTKKHYHIDTKIVSSENLLPQKNDAMGIEIANFVTNNTDIIILTVFSSLETVSIYSVYLYVVSSIRKVLLNFVTGFSAAFGNMYAKKEYKILEENFRIYELIMYSLVSIIFSTTYVMLNSFIHIYTLGINDADYNQPIFGILLSLAFAFFCMKIPYDGLTKAVGHFKQTRNAAIIEAILNITISVGLVFEFGLIGVAIGTLVAMIYRLIVFGIYVSKKIIKRSCFVFVQHTVLTLIIGVITYVFSLLYIKEITNYFAWIVYALITALIAIVLTVTVDLFFYKKDTIKFLAKLKRNFSKK